MKRTSNFAPVARPLAMLALAGFARADLQPEWISRLPVGSALAAGFQGLAVDPAGTSYVTGTTGPSYNTDVVTAAFGPDGALLWSHVFNGPQDSYDQGRAIALAPGGRVVVAGNTAGPLGYANVLVLVYEAATGTLLNTVQYSSGGFASEYGGTVATDAQGGIYVGGGTTGDGADGLVLKFDAAGQFQWKRTWDGPALAPYSQDHVRLLALDPGGTPVVMIEGVMANLHPDYVVVKFAPNDGATLWETTWGANGGDHPRDLEVDATGDVYVTGTAFDFVDKYGTIKLRGSDGQLLWQAYDTADFHNQVAALALDGLGGVYVTGSVDPDGDESNLNDDFYTVKRNAATGALLWTHRYGAKCVGCFDTPSDVLVDPAGHVFLAGGTSSPPYALDAITLVLDATTGVETARGVVSGGPTEMAGSGFLRFDAAYDLFNGGETYDVNSGAIDITVFKYGALNDCATSVYCDEAQNPDNASDIGISSCDLSPGTQVTLANGPAGQSCYLLIGDFDGVVSQPPGASGDLCVSGGSCLGRYAKDVGAISAQGDFATDISDSASGGAGFGIPTCGGSIVSGDTWYFQYWHRRPLGQLSTFSSALRVTFQ